MQMIIILCEQISISVSCRHTATQLFVRHISAMSTSLASERPSQLKDTMLAAGPEKDPCFLQQAERCSLSVGGGGERISLRHCLTNNGHHEEVSFLPKNCMMLILLAKTLLKLVPT